MGHAQMTQAGAEGEDGDPPTPTPPRGAARLFKVSAAHMCYLGGLGGQLNPKRSHDLLLAPKVTLYGSCTHGAQQGLFIHVQHFGACQAHVFDKSKKANTK